MYVCGGPEIFTMAHLSYGQYSVDSKGMLLMDMGFYIGIILRFPLKSFNQLWAYQKY